MKDNITFKESNSRSCSSYFLVFLLACLLARLSREPDVRLKRPLSDSESSQS